MGIARTRATAEKADIILLLLDARDKISEADKTILESLPPNIPRLHIFNKVDLIGQGFVEESEAESSQIFISAKTGEGIDRLRNKLLSLIGWHNEGGVFMARERHIRALLSARQHLKMAEQEMARSELFAEELRLAQEDLNTITGEFSADDLLGEIFSRFCIGK